MAEPGLLQRAAPRIRAHFSSLYSSERQEGTGELVDISSSGARIESVSLRPRIGGRVRLYVFVPGQQTPLELVGHVIRHTETGFAVHYEKQSDAVRALVDTASSLMATTEVDLD